MTLEVSGMNLPQMLRDDEISLIVGERLPSFVSETVGRALVVREVSESPDMIMVTYQDPTRGPAAYGWMDIAPR